MRWLESFRNEGGHAMTSSISLPEHLVHEILAGNCVAFVGAGFSAPAKLPTWPELLTTLAEPLDADLKGHVMRLVARGNSDAFEQAAQVLEDAMARPRLMAEMARLFRPSREDRMAARLRWLGGIPFRAVLTTNFDPLLSGSAPSGEAYWSVLRAGGHRWWDKRFWSGKGPAVVKIHGDLAGDRAHVVLSRRDYRRRLYSDPAYVAFLRSVFSNHTVLYLGFSFSDAYLNELRSEVLALLGDAPKDPDAKKADVRNDEPIAYAIANDVPAQTVDYFRKHERIEMLAYDTGEKQDHSGFDRFLADLHDATNPRHRLAHLLDRRRILWVDPHEGNNEDGFLFLRSISRQADCAGVEVVCVPDAEQALNVLGSGPGADLVITHWGEDTRTAATLLCAIHRRELRVPVIVFAATDPALATARKPIALGLGALAYCGEWETLFRTLEQVFLPGSETV
jgi:hypothetical protein